MAPAASKPPAGYFITVRGVNPNYKLFSRAAARERATVQRCDVPPPILCKRFLSRRDGAAYETGGS